jgi:hypothetical protein
VPADHNFGDKDDDTTRPETPGSLVARTLERFRSSAESICRAVPLLELTEGEDRKRFGAGLAADIDEFAEAAKDLATFVRVSRGR